MGVFRAAGSLSRLTRLTGGPAGQAGRPKWFVRGLADIDDAAHEYIGLLAYWLTGKSSDLFPGPR